MSPRPSPKLSQSRSPWGLAAALLVAAACAPACAKAAATEADGKSPSATLAPRVSTKMSTAELRRALPVAQAKPGSPAPLSADAKRLLERVYTNPGELPQLRIAVGEGDEATKLDLPLKHTHVKAEVSGTIARVEVTQTYQNPFTDPIEAIYVFPLPENSAVDDMRMVIGERTIVANIKRRADARRTYEDAKAQGHTAALLEQERPNVFTQSVANIEPGTDIDIVVRYVQNLTYDAGEYEFVFPMVVGPRYMPGAPVGTTSGSGGARDTTQVPDASRISPPVLGNGLRTGHDISLELIARAGLPIADFDVPTHDIDVTPTYDGRLELRLKPSDSLPNRDFVLKYRVDGAEPQATVLTHRGERGGFLSLIVQPPNLDLEAAVGQREIIFVVDVSGSMHGVPLSMAQEAMTEALRALRPVDTFNVITFSGRTGSVFGAPMPANDDHIKQAMDYVHGLRAAGGTEMMLGFDAALAPDVPDGRRRHVFFMTDGYVGNEDDILRRCKELVAKQRNRGSVARVFGFGVGSSVNRYLLDGIAKAGEGVTHYVTTREDPTLAVNGFFRVIDKPIVSNITIDWGGLAVEEAMPIRVPDLFASRPLVINARYAAAGSGTIRILGDIDGKKIELPVHVELPEQANDNAALSTLWARKKIDWLSTELWSGSNPQVEEAVTKLGLDFRIVTKFTSFVAVDESKKVNGKLHTIVQPVEVPEGVDAEMAGAPVAQTRLHAPAKSTASYGMGYGVGSGGGGIGAGEAYGMGGLGITGRGRVAAPRAAEPAPPPALMTPATPRADTGALGKKVKPKAENKAADKNVAVEKPARADGPSGLSVTGHLGVDVVRAALSRATASLGRCAEAPASMTVRFFVTADGKIIQIKLDAGLSAAAQSCLKAELGKVRLPASAGTTEVRVTLRLR